MLPVVITSYLPYKWEVDYGGFNEAIRVTLVSYHRSKIQSASTINLNVSVVLRLRLIVDAPYILDRW